MSSKYHWVPEPCKKCGKIIETPKEVYHSENTYGYYPSLTRGIYKYCPHCGVV